MVSGSRIDGGSQTISAPVRISGPVRKTIQSIKEVVGNHSDADILVTLQEFNMDPDQTAQKLLYQDLFHEVKSKKDKRKENASLRASSESRKLPEQNTAFKGSSEPRNLIEQNTAFKGSSEPRKLIEQNTAFKGSSEPRKFTERTQGVRSHAFSDRNARRGGYIRNSFPGISREFRIVRDNRAHQNTNREMNPASVQSSTSASVQVAPNVSVKSPTRISADQRHIGPRNSESRKSFQAVNGPSDLGRGQFKDANSNNTNRKGVLEESRVKVPNSVSPSHSSQPSATLASQNTVVGLYSSASDPVHVPSNSRSSGAIRREVGVVGIRRQSSENSANHSNVPSSSVSTSPSVKDISSISEPFHPSGPVLKSGQLVQTPVSESVVSSTSVSKSFLSNQHGGKSHQQAMGHQKATQPNREWKPKSSQKSSSSFISPVVIGTATTLAPSSNDGSTDSKREADHLQEKLSGDSVSENEHVFIPQHLRVPEADRTRLTFGSFGLELDSTKSFSSGFQGLENQQQFNSSSFRAPSASSEDVNQVDLLNGHIRNSESSSPASTAVSEHQSPHKKESSSPGNSESYADTGMVRNNSPSYMPAEPQQQQDPPLPSYAAYDPQTSYDLAFYRPSTNESARSQSGPSPGEVLSSHVANSIPASSLAMVQQQTVPQLYPQVHVSHYPNFMPYRQFVSPVYMPPMGVPGYSSNPAYPHPSNGNSYVLMPGGSSHMSAGGLKYGASQFKPIPAGTPTGFGNYSNPTGYAFNTQGTVGGATGLDDLTRMKYKDGNLYIPNPQGETSEIWIQTPREMPGIQSAPYYNIPGQPPHAAYLPSHPSFNGATTAPPAHLQYPGLYHPSPQQAAAIANPHHMVPNMGSNVGVGAAAPGGAQIGAYQQQPQLGHWNTNF